MQHRCHFPSCRPTGEWGDLRGIAGSSRIAGCRSRSWRMSRESHVADKIPDARAEDSEQIKSSPDQIINKLGQVACVVFPGRIEGLGEFHALKSNQVTAYRPSALKTSADRGFWTHFTFQNKPSPVHSPNERTNTRNGQIKSPIHPTALARSFCCHILFSLSFCCPSSGLGAISQRGTARCN